MMNKDYLAEAEERKKQKELEALKPKVRRRRKKQTTNATPTNEEDQGPKPSSRINMDAYSNLLNKLKGFVDEPEEEFLEDEDYEIEI